MIGAIVLAFPSRVLLEKPNTTNTYHLTQVKNLVQKIQRIIDNVILINILKTSDYEFNELNTNLERDLRMLKKRMLVLEASIA